MNLFITQISKREMEDKTDVLSRAAMRQEEVWSSVEHLIALMASQLARESCTFGKEGPLVLEGQRALVAFWCWTMASARDMFAWF